MTKLGIIGSGAIGAAVARLAVAAGQEVLLSNSRGPESLTALVEELGRHARAATAADAAAFGDIVVLAVPLAAYDALPAPALDGKTVLSTGNYYPSRDGRISDLDSGAVNTAEYEQKFLPGAKLAKAFNNIVAHHIPALARPAGAPDRSGLAVAADVADAKAAVSALVDNLGFDPVDVVHWLSRGDSSPSPVRTRRSTLPTLLCSLPTGWQTRAPRYPLHAFATFWQPRIAPT